MLSVRLFLVGSVAWVAACGTDAGSEVTFAYDGAAARSDAEGSFVDAGAEAARPASLTHVRLAQMSPDLGSVDFCLKPEGGEAIGPLLAAASLDGGTPDFVDFAQVSVEVAVPALGTLQVVVVSAPATACASARAVGSVTLGAGKHATLVVSGVSKGSVEAARAASVSAFADDVSASAAGLRVRFVHAAFGTTITAGVPWFAAALTSGNSVSPVAAEVLPRKAGTPSGLDPVVDALGYHVLPWLPAGEVGVRASISGGDAGPSLWSSATRDWALSAGDARTVFVVSLAAGGSGDLAAVVCDDLRRVPAAPCRLAPAY